MIRLNILLNLRAPSGLLNLSLGTLELTYARDLGHSHAGSGFLSANQRQVVLSLVPRKCSVVFLFYEMPSEGGLVLFVCCLFDFLAYQKHIDESVEMMPFAL